MDNTMTPTKNDLSKKADSFVKRASNVGHDLMESDFGNQLSNRWQEIRDRGEDVYSSSVEVVRRYPLAAISTALAVGIMTGMILKRRH
jgi:ElaB/YqjD/DUF883 family membrane-anchored ribosome-binding protein